MTTLLVLLGTTIAALAIVGVAVARSIVIAQPDEWLLCIRNGRLVKAGVGISLWRRPWDVVARFTSTMQRVGFSVGALSSERLGVCIEGFILWSVSADGDGPFRAFQKLGLVNLAAPPGDLKSEKHLLSAAQHRAFQKLLGAAVQRLSATRPLEELLLRQEPLVAELRGQLGSLEREMAIRIDQIEIVQVRPADEDLLRQMSARIEESVREEAAGVRLEANERAKRRSIESEARIAHEQAEARKLELDRKKALRLAELSHEREVKLREQEMAREQELAAEARANEVARAAMEREEVQFAARLDRLRREAHAKGDAISLVTSAEEKKSQAVRDHELARLVAERVGEALKGLPLREARWITVGPDSPAGSLAGLMTAVRELVSGGADGARKTEELR
jgi:hypothetical protein